MTQKTHRLLIVITGPGKGKSTSALGQALRMAGHGHKVAFLQCIKQRVCGEHKALERYTDCIDLRILGKGFTWTRTAEVHESALGEAWEQIQQCLADPSYSLVVLDEFTYPLARGQVNMPAFLDILRKRPAHMHVLVTGRDAPPELLAAADLVSVIQAEKHPYTLGIPSQQGIEF